jgi:hypothetical protein
MACQRDVFDRSIWFRIRYGRSGNKAISVSLSGSLSGSSSCRRGSASSNDGVFNHLPVLTGIRTDGGAHDASTEVDKAVCTKQTSVDVLRTDCAVVEGVDGVKAQK